MLRREVSIIQGVEALLTKLEGIEFISGGATDGSGAASGRADSSAGSGGERAGSGAASSPAAAAADDVAGSFIGSVGAIVDENPRDISERLQIAIEDTIRNVTLTVLSFIFQSRPNRRGCYHCSRVFSVENGYYSSITAQRGRRGRLTTSLNHEPNRNNELRSSQTRFPPSSNPAFLVYSNKRVLLSFKLYQGIATPFSG